MFSLEIIERATPWELQGMIENIDKELMQLQLLELQLKYSKKDLEIALCLKLNGEHKFENGKCGCGAFQFASN